LRRGSFFPSLLERRRRVDKALFAVVMEAYLHGVSTRKVDDLVKALGADTGISKSEVSRICADLDLEVGAFTGRDLSAMTFPYVFLDATYCKARVNHRVVSQAIVVAVGVAADGRREVLGFDVGDTENEAFWTQFPESSSIRFEADQPNETWQTNCTHVKLRNGREAKLAFLKTFKRNSRPHYMQTCGWVELFHQRDCARFSFFSDLPDPQPQASGRRTVKVVMPFLVVSSKESATDWIMRIPRPGRGGDAGIPWPSSVIVMRKAGVPSRVDAPSIVMFTCCASP
jgi:hypothetical protein